MILKRHTCISDNIKHLLGIRRLLTFTLAVHHAPYLPFQGAALGEGCSSVRCARGQASWRTGFVEIIGITRGTTNQPNLTVNEIAQALSGQVVNATVSMHTWEGNIYKQACVLFRPAMDFDSQMRG